MADLAFGDFAVKSPAVGADRLLLTSEETLTMTVVTAYLETVMGQPVTWTPTVTGFSVAPTITARYIKIGKQCTIWVTMTGSSTSDATTFTITNLPFAASATHQQFGIITVVVDAGATSTSPGRVFTTTSSTTLTLNKDISGAAWTASSTKRASFSFTYETT